MGIQTREGTGKGAVFYKINAKEGCFQTGTKENKVKYPQMTDLVGTLIGFKIDENEYEGQKSEELRLIMADPDPTQPNQHVSVTITTGGDAGMFGLRLLGCLNAVDVTKPITLRPWHIAKGEKLGETVAERDMTGVTVYQDGNKIKEDYGNGVTRLPDLPKLKVGNKEVADKTPWNAMLDPLLDALHERLHPAASEGAPEDDVVDAHEAASAAEAGAPAETAAPTAGTPAANRPMRQRA